jgi:hypothetical protein
MKALIIFPHGLGDQIALVPVLRAWSEKNHIPSIAIQRRFNSSPLDNCPYVNKVYNILSDPWQDYGFHNLKVGIPATQNEGLATAYRHGYSHTIFVANTEEYLSTFEVDIKNYKPEVFISNENRMLASKIIYELVGNNSYGFVQTQSGDPNRNLPPKYGKKWLQIRKELPHVIEVGKDVHPHDLSINVLFEIMNRAKAIVLPNSVFWHAAGALNKKIDLAYFPRGQKDLDGMKYTRYYERTKPIYDEKFYKTTVFQLEMLPS